PWPGASRNCGPMPCLGAGTMPFVFTPKRPCDSSAWRGSRRRGADGLLVRLEADGDDGPALCRDRLGQGRWWRWRWWFELCQELLCRGELRVGLHRHAQMHLAALVLLRLIANPGQVVMSLPLAHHLAEGSQALFLSPQPSQQEAEGNGILV